jgi:organic hydroperoxide reductase OsmC/OhrA
MSDDRRAKQKLTGVYMQRPEEMLRHAISVTLSLAAAMIATRRNTQALITVCADVKLTERAARLVMSHMLRQMVWSEEPSSKDFDRLVQGVVSLAKES